MSTDETGGMYVVSTHALYRLDAPRRTGVPEVTWRQSLGGIPGLPGAAAAADRAGAPGPLAADRRPRSGVHRRARDPRPVRHRPVPQLPMLSPGGTSSVYAYASTSDAYEVSGPLGRDL